MIEWLLDSWMRTALSLGSAGGALTAVFKLAPRTIRRLALMVDCEADRIRWEESDKLRDHRDLLRDGEINLLRTTVVNLQNDILRLQQHFGISGAASVKDPTNVVEIQNQPTSKTPKFKPSEK